ncbi:YdeI family protein [Pleurocapsa sp. PCC 7319]|uniref:YdeI/OmpD-associated family protein n=1 Tax=Pleurocapsa sp. PCC 7319 TaxID=118161 RepID=UPI00034A5821|nr:YdeI/OmpD-associated family protein [Pleurocapsa sp. PCC 7319]
MKDRPQFTAKTRQEWRNWLKDNHAKSEGIWLVTYKKNSGISYLPYNDIVEEALCFGWIDSLPRKLDEQRTMLYVSPRKDQSNWSKANKDRVAKLLKQGLMTPPGIEKVNMAKVDGSWSFLDDVEALILPDDLLQALAQNPIAEKYFTAFPPSVKRGILEWIKNAKRFPTREKRISKTVELAAKNVRANF